MGIYSNHIINKKLAGDITTTSKTEFKQAVGIRKRMDGHHNGMILGNNTTAVPTSFTRHDRQRDNNFFVFRG